ncbi:hypothetical protein OAG53_02665 [Akkermansiaceae bacterium]|nr:hypothetical protein [Akkermansiaceae bacterium]
MSLTFGELIFHQKPRPLSRDAVTTEWPRFFGPNDNCTTDEGPLLKEISEGLKPVFELERGPSYASPIIADGKLLHFHAVKGQETLDCVHPETGERIWRFTYPLQYKDRYGFAAGPRTSPVVHHGRIYLIGVTAGNSRHSEASFRKQLACHPLLTGHSK